MTFAKEAWPFVVPVLVAAGALALLKRPSLAVAVAILGLVLLLFFRIPSRSSSEDPNVVLAPANGKITSISTVHDPEFGPGEYHHIVTFLSVFNIHVQRAPVEGRVVASEFRQGRKVAAFREDAGDVNQNHLTVFEQPGGELVAMKQISGLLARRVVSYLDVGAEVARGDLIGVIKFGSRVDLFVPAHYRLLIEEGKTVFEGESPMAVDDLRDAA